MLKLDPDIVNIQNLTVKYTGWRSVVMSQVARKLKKLKPNIRLVVVQHDIADGLAATDIFVSLPDRGADMRNTSIHTAMLAQLPVVTLQNEGYYIDKQIAERGCYTVDSPGAHRLCENILEVYQSPPSGQFRQQLATWFDPERIWQQHIETNLRTYEGKPPESLAAFNTG